MSRVLTRWRWQWYRDRLGPDHPRVRALFGRYVAAIGGALTPRAGGVAYRAWRRRREPGFYNRSYRRHHVWDL